MNAMPSKTPQQGELDAEEAGGHGSGVASEGVAGGQHYLGGIKGDSYKKNEQILKDEDPENRTKTYEELNSKLDKAVVAGEATEPHPPEDEVEEMLLSRTEVTDPNVLSYAGYAYRWC